MRDLLLILAFSISTVRGAFSTHNGNPLNGQHLRVLGLEFPISLMMKKNSTGHVVSADGVLCHMMDTLAMMQNFSYSYVPVPGNRTPSFEDSLFGKGAVSYLINNEADYVLSSIIGTPSRFQQVDFSASYYYGPFSTIVPYPEVQLDFTATLKPLNYEVWILVAVATLSAILFLHLLITRKWTGRQKGTEASFNEKTDTNKRFMFMYVIGNLLSQGQILCSKRLVIRIVAGTWCCACFFLIQIYSSTLTSHLTMPNQKPIVDSFYDIANTPGVSLTVNRGFGIDNILQGIEKGHLKPLADMLRNNPALRCNITADCLERVKKGNAVFSGPDSSLRKIVDENLRNTNTCQFSLLKETFWSSHIFTTLRKNSPYSEVINRGIWRLRETGLVQQWISWYQPTPSRCMQRKNPKKSLPRLSLNHLSSAFVLLVGGYVISTFLLFIEKVVFLARILHRTHIVA